MKITIKLKALLLVFLGVIAFSSCGEDDDDFVINLNPTLNIYEHIGSYSEFDEVLFPTEELKNSSKDHFSILKAAIEKAGLVSNLSDAGNYTLLAPSNEAFTNYLAGSSLDDFTPDQLKTILLKHVIPVKYTYSYLLDTPDAIETLEGLTLPVDYFKTVNFLNFDIQATNGVIHFVDKVIE